MSKLPFRLSAPDDVILLDAFIEGYPIRLALDTAATHTTIDLNALLIVGLTKEQGGEWVPLETSNGVIDAQYFTIQSFEVLGDELQSFQVLSYDFLEKGILSNYEGVLGLDFFRHRHVLTVDFIDELLWLELPHRR